MVVGTWLQGAGLTCGHPPRAEPSGVEDFGHTQRHKEPGQTLSFRMFQREAFVPLDCTQKYIILDTLGVKYLPGISPQCLMEVQKPPPKPHLGRPRAEGSCSMGGYRRSRGVFWAMTHGHILCVNPEIGTKITIKQDKPCTRKHLMTSQPQFGPEWSPNFGPQKPRSDSSPRAYCTT